MGVLFCLAPMLMLAMAVVVGVSALSCLGVCLLLPTRRCFRLIVIGLARRRTMRLAGDYGTPLVMLVVMFVSLFVSH